MTNAEQVREAAGRFATIDLHTETNARFRIQQTGRNRPARNRVGPPVLLPFDQRAGKGRESQSETISMLKRHPFAFILFAASLISSKTTRFCRPPWRFGPINSLTAGPVRPTPNSRATRACAANRMMSFDSRVAIYIAVSVITLFAFSVEGKAQLPEQQPQEENPETEIEPTPLPGTEILPAPQFQGEEPVVKVIPQNATVSTPNEGGVDRLSHFPVHLSLGVDTGYDDNVTLQPSGEGSLFTRENVVLSYHRPGERTQLYLLGIGRFTQFFDVTGQDDTSGNVTLSLTHNFSTRLSFYASIYGSYQTEPNFQSNIGPENVRAAHFDTTDIFSVTYHWLLRFTTVTSYTFQRIKYDQSSIGMSQIGISQIGMSQDRVDSTLGEQLQFSLTSRTNLGSIITIH